MIIGAGYLALAYLAKDNLQIGLDVIVDTVNPTEITRKMWREAAVEANAVLVNIEVTCKNKVQHRRQVESRVSDIKGMVVPNWEKVIAREYEPWEEDCLMVDTSELSTPECVEKLISGLASINGSK